MHNVTKMETISGVVDQALLRPGTLRPVKENVHITAVLAHAPEQATFAVDQVPGVLEFDDAPVVEDQDLVVVDNGLQAVRNRDDCAIVQFAQGLLDLGIGGVVDGGGGFVHH